MCIITPSRVYRPALFSVRSDVGSLLAVWHVLGVAPFVSVRHALAVVAMAVMPLWIWLCLRPSVGLEVAVVVAFPAVAVVHLSLFCPSVVRWAQPSVPAVVLCAEPSVPHPSLDNQPVPSIAPAAGIGSSKMTGPLVRRTLHSLSRRYACHHGGRCNQKPPQLNQKEPAYLGAQKHMMVGPAIQNMPLVRCENPY